MVTIFIIYLLKACGAVTLFTLAYTLLLRHDSHLMARRWFLMAAILTSFIFQVIPSPLPSTIATAEPTETIEATTSIETSNAALSIDRCVGFTNILFIIWAVVRYATLPMLVVALAMTNAPATTVESTQGDKVKIVEGGTTQTRSSSEILDKLSSQTNPMGATPLIIMDEEEITKEQFEALDYEQVSRVSILKDDVAVEKYGEKGKNGVIIVGSKK